jgi:hypothetical protein
MRRSLTGFLFVVCTLAIVMLGAATAWTQSMGDAKATLYTYVAEWAVPRAMWADYQKMEASGTDSMNKLVADGTLVSYGRYTVLNHQEGNPTHGSWFSAHSMANLLKVLEVIRNTPDSTGPVLSASKHWDYLFESHDYDAHSGSFKNGYLRVGRWKYKPGASDPDGKITKATMVAMFDKLLADGAIHDYQVDQETIHSSDPDTFWVAFIANGPEGIDKFNAAVEENRKKNPAGMAGFGSLLDSEGHRDFLAFVDYINHK